MNNSINIILHQYKNGNITEEEAVQLIEGLYRNNYAPVFPYWPQITWWSEPKKWEVTCNYDSK
jgi:hypothetical protein